MKRFRQTTSRFRRWLSDIRDVRRANEITRLITRAGRRCARDLRHAVDELPPGPVHDLYRERLDRWFQIFWDAQAYRDELHLTIDRNTRSIERLEKLLEEHGIDHREVPF